MTPSLSPEPRRERAPFMAARPRLSAPVTAAARRERPPSTLRSGTTGEGIKGMFLFS